MLLFLSFQYLFCIAVSNERGALLWQLDTAVCQRLSDQTYVLELNRLQLTIFKHEDTGLFLQLMHLRYFACGHGCACRAIQVVHILKTYLNVVFLSDWYDRPSGFRDRTAQIIVYTDYLCGDVSLRHQLSSYQKWMCSLVDPGVSMECWNLSESKIWRCSTSWKHCQLKGLLTLLTSTLVSLSFKSLCCKKWPFSDSWTHVLKFSFFRIISVKNVCLSFRLVCSFKSFHVCP